MVTKKLVKFDPKKFLAIVDGGNESYPETGLWGAPKFCYPRANRSQPAVTDSSACDRIAFA
jgi:hypothetical protein